MKKHNRAEFPKANKYRDYADNYYNPYANKHPRPEIQDWDKNAQNRKNKNDISDAV